MAVIPRQVPATSILEVGCNVGGNLRWLAPAERYGVDVNATALARARKTFADLNLVRSPARELPFRDRWFDLVFTMGVLIHVPAESLPLVLAEMVRCSSRWVLMGEYHAAEPTEIPYRGETGALVKRDYGAIFGALFPAWSLVDEGFLGRDTGWDDVTWWLFERGDDRGFATESHDQLESYGS